MTKCIVNIPAAEKEKFIDNFNTGDLVRIVKNPHYQDWSGVVCLVVDSENGKNLAAVGNFKSGIYLGCRWHENYLPKLVLEKLPPGSQITLTVD